MLDFIGSYWYSLIIFGLLVAIAAGFAVRFVRPALRLGGELAAAVAALEDVRRGPGADLRAAVGAKAMVQPALARVWEEYAQTLHAQRGEGGVARWRATALAEVFFTDQALVDTPLKTEYYKHLPGILTGLGIIGTFTGLILGLSHFDVSLDPGLAQGQLRALIHSVGHAFVVSAIAISLAMLFTWIEKSLITARYRQVEQLRQRIDSLFDAGADVEYLERLVVANERAVAQASEIKDALVQELRGIFSGLTAQQIDATAGQGERIAQNLGKLLEASLGRPIADIAAAVDAVSKRQDETVTRMIEEVLAGVAAQMQNAFAAQMRDTHALLLETNAAMQQAAGQFGAAVARMGTSSDETVTALGSRLQESVEAAERRQATAQQRADENVERVRTALTDALAANDRRLDGLLAKLGDEVGGAVGRLQEQTLAAAATQREQSDRLVQATETTVAGLSGQIERLLALSAATNQSLQATVERLAGGTQAAVDGMNAGAARLAEAAGQFAGAGADMQGAMSQATAVVADMQGAAAALAASAESAQRMIADYTQAGDAFAAMVADLRDTVRTAKRDAAISADLVDRLQAAAERLAAAQGRADEYLSGVSRVLEQAHQAFADNVERTLRESNRQFHNELSQAVGLLSGAVQDLGETVEAMAAARP